MGRSRPEGTNPTRCNRTTAVLGLLVTLAALNACGCAQNEIGRYAFDNWVVENPKRVRNLIVDNENYWIQRDIELEEAFPGPTPADLAPPETDYILGAGDLLNLTVYELLAPNQPYGTRQRITQSGQITIPYVGTIKAAGLTARGLEQKIADVLEPDYIIDPQVTIFIEEYRNLSVAILNGVFRPGVIPMDKQDMTLLEAVARAGGMIQLVEDHGYVIREYSPDEADLLILESGLPLEELVEDEGAAEAEAPAESETEAVEEAAPATEAEVAPAATEPEVEIPAGLELPDVAPGGGTAEEAPPAATTEPEGTLELPAEAPAEETPAEEPAPTPDTGLELPAAPAGGAETPDEARSFLQRMAEGEMPEVAEVEAAEAAAAEVETAPVPPVTTPPAGEEMGRWVWSDGRWVEVKPAEETQSGETAPETVEPDIGRPEAGEPPKVPEPVEPDVFAEGLSPLEPAVGPEEAPADTARRQLADRLRRLGVVQGSGQLKRIIRFDVQALMSGDPTQNIVLRDGDIVTIPSPPQGDFYMYGQVVRQGVYSLTGRKITVLQAVAAAGGLTGVAVPWRTEVVRRIREDQEEIIYCDLAKIARGEAPDFYVQPEDLIRVGTDQGAIYNAVLRNAFRATYGLGYVYDMNFADFYPWTDGIYPLFPGAH